MFPDSSLSARKRLRLTVDSVWAQNPTMSARTALTTSSAMSDGRRWPRSSVSRIQLTGGMGSWSDRGGAARVLGVVLVEELELAVVLREHEEHERGADDDRDQAGGVGPVRAVDERRLRGRD